MLPERALVGVTGGNLPFQRCAPASCERHRITDAVYSATMQSGESVQIFISPSGQLLREIPDLYFTTVTVDFEYANV